MTLLKKTFFAPVAFATVLASVQAVAAPINHTIQLEAFVPTTDFHVLPVDTSWPGTTQRLNYTPLTQDLTSLTKQFYVKNTAGAINGKLLSAAIIGSGPDVIPLTVNFNGKALSTIEQEVVTSAQALTESIVNLEIIPEKPVGGYKPGTYTGNVNVAFDAVP